MPARITRRRLRVAAASAHPGFPPAGVRRYRPAGRPEWRWPRRQQARWRRSWEGSGEPAGSTCHQVVPDATDGRPSRPDRQPDQQRQLDLNPTTGRWTSPRRDAVGVFGSSRPRGTWRCSSPTATRPGEPSVISRTAGCPPRTCGCMSRRRLCARKPTSRQDVPGWPRWWTRSRPITRHGGATSPTPRQAVPHSGCMPRPDATPTGCCGCSPTTTSPTYDMTATRVCGS